MCLAYMPTCDSKKNLFYGLQVIVGGRKHGLENVLDEKLFSCNNWQT